MRLVDKLKRIARALAADAPSMKAVNQPARARHTGELPVALKEAFNEIPVNDFLNDRWDREWLHYFLHENPRPYLVGQDFLTLNASLAGRSAETVYATELVSVRKLTEFSTLGTLGIWVPGDDLVDRHVLEIGCGPGFLGKQIGMVATSYTGIDYSQFALGIARLTSPASCAYYHLSDAAGISGHTGTIDTMVGRNFCIHQNYQNLLWLLKLARVLLKAGGLVAADFYLGNPAMPRGVVHGAHETLDRLYASCAFEFTRDDIETAATAAGFRVQDITDKPELQRRFVFFRKPE